MIAICPNCHDDVHHGRLPIDDETIYRWKQIKREETKRDHVYVEPGDSSKLLLGTIAVTGQQGVTVFELGDSNKLSFRLADEDIMLLNLAVSTTAGDEVLRVVEGYVKHQAEDPVAYERRQGHVRVTAPVSDEFMPGWAVSQLRVHEPDFAADGRLPLLDIEVLERGLVRVQGIWNAPQRWNPPQRVVAITTHSVSFLDPGRQRPIALVGGNGVPVIDYRGPITAAMFDLGDGSGGVHIPQATPPKLGRNEPCWCGSGEKFKRCHGA